MIDNEKIDLSVLEPDEARWQAVVDSTISRVNDVLIERASHDDDVIHLIARWRRPLLAAAAAVIAALIPAEIALEMRESRAEVVQRLVVLSASSAQGERAPTAAEILRTMAAGASQ